MPDSWVLIFERDDENGNDWLWIPVNSDHRLGGQVPDMTVRIFQRLDEGRGDGFVVRESCERMSSRHSNQRFSILQRFDQFRSDGLRVRLLRETSKRGSDGASNRCIFALQ